MMFICICNEDLYILYGKRIIHRGDKINAPFKFLHKIN